jgi:hypothetical protein
MELKKEIDNLRGKYIKQVLTSIEQTNKLDQDVRKSILDAFNEYTRELYKLLGVSEQ